MSLKYMTVIKIFVFIITSTSFVVNVFAFGSSLQRIRNKAKDIYQSKFGKDNSINYLGYDQTEYPGTNEKFRRKNKAKWDEYYNCLKAQQQNLGAHSSVTPEAIQGFEGGTIKLECKVCLSPSERKNAESVEWFWGNKTATTLTPIETSEHILISPDDKILHLYNLQFESTGQYLCKLGGTLTAPYFLTVANVTDDNVTQVHSASAPGGPYRMPPERIEYGLVLDTEFGPWSACSKCDKIGRRHRLGYCVIYTEIKYTDEFTVTNTTESPTLVTITDLELVTLFKNGIPCNSHILPQSIKNLDSVKNRKHEIMTGYCRPKCSGERIFVVRDKNGNILEKANNSAGVYSVLQGLPPVEPEVERKLEYGIMGKDIALSCPGNINSDAPIQWQIGPMKIIPEVISSESNGRIYVSITDRLHIKKAKIADSNLYSCWQQTELAGTIRLVVEKKLELNFNHHLMLLGIVIILTTFLYVFARAFFGRKFARIV